MMAQPGVAQYAFYSSCTHMVNSDCQRVKLFFLLVCALVMLINITYLLTCKSSCFSYGDESDHDGVCFSGA